MSIKKRYLKTKPICKVTFRLSKKAAKGAEKVYLVGDFNEWDKKKAPMRKLKDGSFSKVLDLQPGKEYQFRYLLDNKEWENDWKADKYVKSSYPGVDNSLVTL